jgi:putative PIN family toxin of toxin-antitoxin system
MPRAALDSSALISAFLTPKGTCADVLRAAARGAFVLCLSPEILGEVASVLLRNPKLQARYGYDRPKVEEFVERLLSGAQLVTDLPTGRFVLADQKDDAIVATAIAAQAKYLITGDRKHLLALGECQGVRIITPRQFLDRLSN